MTARPTGLVSGITARPSNSRRKRKAFCAICGNRTRDFLRLTTGFTRTLVLCDVVIRPRLVIASNHLVGSGASGLFKGMALATVKPWLDQGKIIINNMPG